ncbi:hypothetical protein [Streptomyces sp. NPDC058548]|uniref:hypothetical protein n=1 Tax=Streptomyces sp. NPDC058548 TaxID=3346545 RepID=UPI0036560229
MRVTIRRTTPNALQGDVDATIPLLEIEDGATYYQLLEIDQPGQAPSIDEEILSGFQVRELIRKQLLLVMTEIEQDGPGDITVRCTERFALSGHGPQRCTYSKVC